jgi:sugar/nucleoside kinase (ribokinase family)
MPPEILCFGAICADLRMLLPRFPLPGEGVRVREHRWAAGGNSLIEARALAAWGERVALCGDWLGHDEPGDLLAAELQQLGLDAHVRRNPTARTVVCHILITPDGQRTILALRPDGPPPELPGPELLGSCHIVSVTRYGPRSAELAAAAKAAGRLVVAGDATRPDDALARHADLIVTSADLLAAHAPGVAVEAQMAALHAVRGATIAVSDGPQPARVLWAENNTHRLAAALPPAVVPRDTTGAGDIFRAALVRGFLHAIPWPLALEQAVGAASAAIRGEESAE